MYGTEMYILMRMVPYVIIILLLLYMKNITTTQKQQQKVIVFDMDETLGHFVEMGIFWDSLQNYMKQYKVQRKLTQMDFNVFLDLYPEFLRPQIMKLLGTVKREKQAGRCDKVLIYTNNGGPKTWVNLIRSYFEIKMDYPLFDQVIYGYGKDPHRRTEEKTIQELIRCGKLEPQCIVCFVDDVLHPNMKSHQVHYNHIKPYSFFIPYEEMIRRAIKTLFFKDYIHEVEPFSTFMLQHMKRFQLNESVKSREEHDVDYIVSKKLGQQIQSFF